VKVPAGACRPWRVDGGDRGSCLFTVRFWRLDLRVSVIFCWTRALQPWSPSVSGAPAAPHGCAVSRRSVRGLHAPVWFSDWGCAWWPQPGLFVMVGESGGARKLLAFECWWVCLWRWRVQCTRHHKRRLFRQTASLLSVSCVVCYLCFLRQFALCKYKLSLWQSPKMCDRLPVQVKVYVNVDASFCWLGFFSSNCQSCLKMYVHL
jgi:hypothetical protein